MWTSKSDPNVRRGVSSIEWEKYRPIFNKPSYTVRDAANNHVLKRFLPGVQKFTQGCEPSVFLTKVNELSGSRAMSD